MPIPEAAGREAERLSAALSFLGLARRAGRAPVGREAVDQARRRGRLAALVVAGDAARGSTERARRWAREADVPCLVLADRARLGAALGRGRCAVVAVTDAELAARLVEIVRWEEGASAAATAGGRR